MSAQGHAQKAIEAMANMEASAKQGDESRTIAYLVETTMHNTLALKRLVEGVSA